MAESVSDDKPKTTVSKFEPVMNVINQIATGLTLSPHVTMRYELLRFCTLRNYPRKNKPYITKLAEAGFYYASDGDGVVCYACGIRRYNWTADDRPWEVHKRINPNCKFILKNEEVNVPIRHDRPYSDGLKYIMSIPEPIENSEPSEDVNNDWAPERVVNNPIKTSSPKINSAIPKYAQYATKTAREASYYNGWPNTATPEPRELAEAGFFYTGFGDCVRCFFCGTGLRHWDADDSPWTEHARWSKDCAFVKQKKGEEFINLVQLAVQYSEEAPDDRTRKENLLRSNAAQSVIEMGYQPRIVKRAIEKITSRNANTTITAENLMEEILDSEDSEAATRTNATPKPTAEKENSPKKADKDTKTLKKENEKLKEQTLCKVCFDNAVHFAFLPCGHLATCAECAPAVTKCPICRAVIKGTVRVFVP